MCSVFAESEVISLIASNKEKCDIIHCIHNLITSKSYSLLKRKGVYDDRWSCKKFRSCEGC
jgi:activator of 2-hydroxyglutaryl-CoA dehydratase